LDKIVRLSQHIGVGEKSNLRKGIKSTESFILSYPNPLYHPIWASQNQKAKLAHKIGTLTKLKIKIYFIFV